MERNPYKDTTEKLLRALHPDAEQINKSNIEHLTYEALLRYEEFLEEVFVLKVFLILLIVAFSILLSYTILTYGYPVYEVDYTYCDFPDCY